MPWTGTVLVLGLVGMGAWMQAAEAREVRHEKLSVSAASSARMTSVSSLEIFTFGDTENMSAVILVAGGWSPDGQWVQRRHTLPKSYRVEKEPYAEFVDDPGSGWHDRYHRILYNFRGRDLIAGVAWYYGAPGWPPEKWDFDRAQLTNVDWGYDLEKRQFWIHPSPTDMPPVPVVVREEADWKGRLVAIPVELEHVDRSRARDLIEARGGYLARPGELPEIVLLPDDVDFAWARNRDAEAWVRRGAKVLWEKHFPYPGAGDRRSHSQLRAAGNSSKRRAGNGARLNNPE